MNRTYGIKVINEKTGRELMLNLMPMTHAQACTFKSKMTNYAWRRVELVEVAASMTPAQAKRANEQIRRLRAGLIEARDTLRDHFGPDDAAVVAAERALAGPDAPAPIIPKCFVCGTTQNLFKDVQGHRCPSPDCIPF